VFLLWGEADFAVAARYTDYGGAGGIEQTEYRYDNDAAGNRTKIPNEETGRVIRQTFDGQNRLQRLAEDGRESRFLYDAHGNLRIQELANGVRVESEFDAVHRLIRARAINPAGAPLYEYVYTYDPGGRLAKAVESTGAALEQTERSLRYNASNHLVEEDSEGITQRVLTAYVYDPAGNRKRRTTQVFSRAFPTEPWVASAVPQRIDYVYSSDNELLRWSGGDQSAAYAYDENGNRTRRIVDERETTYRYDALNRLIAVDDGGEAYRYRYDHRSRRVKRFEAGVVTRVSFSAGISVWEGEVAAAGEPARTTVEYIRAHDRGGGVGSLLYSARPDGVSFAHSNARGDVVARSDGAGVISYQARYEAFGRREAEFGETPDRQRANTKEEDPTGLLNEGYRYRDLETGTFLSRDPAGFIDGPNLYAYVSQNPWTYFDPEGLQRKGHDDYDVKGKGHHVSPVENWKENKFSKDVQQVLDSHTVGTEGHNNSGHGQYNKRTNEITKSYIERVGKDPSGLSGKEAREFADGLVKEIQGTSDPYVSKFNTMVAEGKSPVEIQKWSREYKAGVKVGSIKDAWHLGDGKFMGKGGVVGGAKKVFGAIGQKLPGYLRVAAGAAMVSEFSSDLQAGESVGEAARTQYYRFGSLEGNTPEEQREVDKQRSDGFFNWLMQ
jgi:RHS repeat-associated protein